MWYRIWSCCRIHKTDVLEPARLGPCGIAGPSLVRKSRVALYFQGFVPLIGEALVASVASGYVAQSVEPYVTEGYPTQSSVEDRRCVRSVAALHRK